MQIRRNVFGSQGLTEREQNKKAYKNEKGLKGLLSIIIMSERYTISDETEDRKCSKCHKIKSVQNFRLMGAHTFRTCNACRFRARQLRRDRSPTWNASVSLSSSSALSLHLMKSMSWFDP